MQENTGQARTMQNSEGQDRTMQDSADQCRMVRLDNFTVIRSRVLVPHSGCRSCWLVSGTMWLWPRRLDNIFVEYIDCIYTLECTDKKENQIFLIFNEIQNGAIAKSHMSNGLLIY